MADIEQAASTKTWDGAAAPGAAGKVRSFEAAWKAARHGSRPEPRDFLPGEPSERPAVLLALLRSEIGLRWDDGDRLAVERYRDRYPELDPDGLVALIYEEFCLREEAGEAPFPGEYDERFPDVAPRLRRVFDIHDLVGSGGSAAFRATENPEVPFPESGQTTAGFRLLEELGRGSFARVFLAEERQLADRPVALKVTRNGTREPQTLARLQHTHIVPVHSSRTDPATGLHLLCMPYFGRVTLERLLAEPGARTARTGADVLAALDRLEPSTGPDGVTARSVFAGLPYARALAWWGARLAEALAHAHERGVLHRDIKPSNVLVTSDGLPMLLDFNLSRDPYAEAIGPSMGGTLAYMAPEHLDALAEGNDRGVDHRADVYSLGVLLFESLTGRRPFSIPTGASSVADALRRAADERRGPVPTIRETHPEIPAAMEAVVLKCLAASPDRRYPDASTLADDLRAVADDAPLAFAREPFLSRAIRWTRRRRWPIALAVLVGLGWVFLAYTLLRARDDQHRTVRLVARWIDEGSRLADRGEWDRALHDFSAAIRLVENTPDFERQPPLVERRGIAGAKIAELNRRIEASRRLDHLVATAERLRSRSPSAPDRAHDDLLAIDLALRPFIDPTRGFPIPAGGPDLLPREAGLRAVREIEILLYAKALILGRREGGDRRLALAVCAIGRGVSRERASWDAIEAWLRDPSSHVDPPGAGGTTTPIGSILLGMLAEAQRRPEVALGWLKQAVRLEGGSAASYVALSRLAIATGNPDDAQGFAMKAVDRTSVRSGLASPDSASPVDR